MHSRPTYYRAISAGVTVWKNKVVIGKTNEARGNFSQGKILTPLVKTHIQQAY